MAVSNGKSAPCP